MQIVQRGALEPLLALTKSTDVEVQMEVLACLCNLSLCGCIGDQPKKFMDALDVETLISFLCSADTTYRLFAAVTLGNVAADETLQDEIVEGGASGTVGHSRQRCGFRDPTVHRLCFMQSYC